MRIRERRLRGEEAALWRQVTRSVVPLAGRRPEDEPAPAAEPEAKPHQPVAAAPVAAAARKPAAPSPAVPAAFDRRTRTALKRGQMPVDASLDLHGYRQDEAHRVLIRFLIEAQARNARFVLVVTGKGARDPDAHPFAVERGVLRRLVPQWLASPAMRSLVSGLDEAARRHGGDGAIYVRLRRPSRPQG